jgi:N-methylhydantoinase A
VVQREIAAPLGISVEEAAWGIHTVVNTNMALAMREATIRRGHDPRTSSIVAFGGAGPLHACRLAKELEIPRVLVPINAGVTSAFGLLAASARFDLVQTFATKLANPDLTQINRLYAEQTQRAQDLLALSQAAGSATLTRSADMRYVGQGYEVRVPLPDGDLTGDTLHHIQAAFERVYRERYGFLNQGAALEVMNWRLSALATPPVLALQQRHNSQPAGEARKGTRRAFFPERGGFTECAVYDWYRLAQGATVNGPAFVEARETSVAILPGDRAVSDEFGNLLIEIDLTRKGGARGG